MTPHDKAINLIDDLNYLSYRHNRRISPQHEPQFWSAIFGEDRVSRYEERMQNETFEERKQANEVSYES